MNDPVNHPSHYQTENGMEAIDVIEAFFKDDYYLGTAFKYIARAGKKNDKLEDLQKARWYLNRAIGDEELDEESELDYRYCEDWRDFENWTRFVDNRGIEYMRLAGPSRANNLSLPGDEGRWRVWEITDNTPLYGAYREVK